MSCRAPLEEGSAPRTNVCLDESLRLLQAGRLLRCFKDNHAGAHDPHDLIDPGQEDPDHFLFIDRSGRVLPRHGITEDDRRRANETIRVLNLNLDHRGLQARSLCAERRRVLETYLQPQPDLLEALESLTDDERRSFIATEVATESNRPFGSIVRHFFEGMW
jgi:hypothetical protein